MILSVLAEFRLAVGMPGTHRQVGKAQQLHLASPLMCCESERWRERKCVCMERNTRSRAYGWKDRQREAWMYAVRNVCTKNKKSEEYSTNNILLPGVCECARVQVGSGGLWLALFHIEIKCYFGYASSNPSPSLLLSYAHSSQHAPGRGIEVSANTLLITRINANT